MVLLLPMCLLVVNVKAQPNYPILLEDKTVLIESSDAVHELYNFQFKRAEKQFRWLWQKYPEHPLAYFLMGLSAWWKIMPDIENRAYDDSLVLYMDIAIEKASALYKANPNNLEAVFFLAASHGFKARLYSERQWWRKATFEGKRSLDYLDMYKDKELLSSEFLFGNALYNYFYQWIKENYPSLKPILVFFPKGDKQLGIKQLIEVAHNAFYTRTEAQYFLMRIYAFEGQSEKCFELSKYLNTTYPENGYFHRFFARMAYERGKHHLADSLSYSLLSKVKRGQMGYENNAGRYATYFLGYSFNNIRNNPDSAYYYFEQSVMYAEKVKGYEMGYSTSSFRYLARIANKKGNKDVATKWYKLLYDNTEKGASDHKEAEKFLLENKVIRKKILGVF